MNVVMIIPTGIGCEIGGHAGDATSAARLLGACCDKLILHPNVVNASDINEMPENAWYVEGSILDRFLEGKLSLQSPKQNKILVVVNKPVRAETINAVSAARATLGIDVKIAELKTPLRMVGRIENERAAGYYSGATALVEQVQHYNFDALAIATLIEVERDIALHYFHNGGVNPWGGIEAITSRFIATKLNKPTAHAPIQPEEAMEELHEGKWNFVCDARMAAEIVSQCFVFCVLKGLHKAPRIGDGLSVKDVDVLVSPHGCWGRPHRACKDAGIPIIVVKENETVLEDAYPQEKYDLIFVENYFEAAGVVLAMKSGIARDSVRRPLKATEVLNG